MTITIYGSIGSRASRCLWTVEEIGIPYTWKPVSRQDGSSRTPEFLAISPAGTFPALTDGDVAITESFAINQYLASTYGSASIWPNDPRRQALALQWSFWSATEIEYFIGAIFAERFLKPEADRDPAVANTLLATMLAKFAVLESALAGRDYLLGAFSLADISVAVQTFIVSGRFNNTLAEFPNIRAWTQRCAARPARRKIDALLSAARPS